MPIDTRVLRLFFIPPTNFKIKIFTLARLDLFRCVLASLKEGLSVRPLVSRSVGRSVHPSVGPSVHHACAKTKFFGFFWTRWDSIQNQTIDKRVLREIFTLETQLTLPKSVSQTKSSVRVGKHRNTVRTHRCLIGLVYWTLPLLFFLFWNHLLCWLKLEKKGIPRSGWIYFRAKFDWLMNLISLKV